MEKAGINVDINPPLFEKLGIRQVPVIAVVNGDGTVKKSVVISLEKALELAEVKIADKENENIKADIIINNLNAFLALANNMQSAFNQRENTRMQLFQVIRMRPGSF